MTIHTLSVPLHPIHTLFIPFHAIHTPLVPVGAGVVGMMGGDACVALVPLHTIPPHAHGSRQIVAPTAAHTKTHACLLQPFVRQPLFNRVLVQRPRIVTAVIEKTSFPLVILLLIEFARQILPVLQAHTIVFLAALVRHK